MSNLFQYNDISYNIGDTVTVDYKIKDGEKERIQQFTGILIKVRGDGVDNRMITVRKISKSGIGVERIIPASSPFIDKINLVKKTNYRKSRLYFIRDLSDKKMRRKLYHKKVAVR